MSHPNSSRRPSPVLTAPPNPRMTPARRDARRDRLLTVIGQDAPTTARPSVAVAPAGRRPRPARRRVLVLAAATAITASTITLTTQGYLPHLGSVAPAAQAATPPLLHYRPLTHPTTAEDLLRRLATIAAATTEARPGGIRYVATQSWALDTAVAHGHADSTVIPLTTRAWIRGNGARHVITATGTQPPQTEDLPARTGTYPVRTLSTDPNTLTRQLDVGNILDHGPVGYLQAIAEVWDQEPPTPQVHAAMLRLLAEQPGLRERGTVTDRLGRPGLAVSIDSAFSGLPTRYTLILDPTTGTMLAYEEELTTDAGKLDVPIPSVISYTTWARYGWVTTVGKTPPPTTP